MVDDGQQADGNAWSDDIPPERQAELEQHLQAWRQETDHGDRIGPFDHVDLTGADVFWLAARALVGASDALAIAQQVGRLRRKRGRSRVRDDIRLESLHLEGALLFQADLDGAVLRGAHLEQTLLGGACLENADLGGVHLEAANLVGARLAGADLRGAWLQMANLTSTRMDVNTLLAHVRLDSETRIADVVWNGASITGIAWDEVHVLGDERLARSPRNVAGKKRDEGLRLGELDAAIRANRQLANSLRTQGLSELADGFAYRGRVLYRMRLRKQRRLARWLLSVYFDAVTGYGYHPGRSVVTYLLLIVGFAVSYFGFGRVYGPSLSPWGAFILSVTSFHGRGVFSQAIGLEDPVMKLVALEAVVGLIVEVSFIATFTQRFFTR